jgi:hypothetical protein
MVEVLASTLVANFLLPFVKDGLKVIADKVAKSAGEAAGEEAASVTKRVWARVARLFGAKPEQEEVLRDFQEDPDTTASYLTKRLARLLEADPEAARELAALVETPAPGSDQTIATVMGNSGVTITVTGSTLTNSPITGISHGAGRDPRG